MCDSVGCVVHHLIAVHGDVCIGLCACAEMAGGMEMDSVTYAVDHSDGCPHVNFHTISLLCRDSIDATHYPVFHQMEGVRCVCGGRKYVCVCGGGTSVDRQYNGVR